MVDFKIIFKVMVHKYPEVGHIYYMYSDRDYGRITYYSEGQQKQSCSGLRYDLWRLRGFHNLS